VLSVDEMLSALGNATVEEREINPLSYNPDDYATIQDVVSHILHRKKTLEVKELLPQLSLYGTVIQDEMTKYLTAPANSASALKQILKTPLHYWCYLHEKIPVASKKAFEFGTFCHMAFLEPDLFDEVMSNDLLDKGFITLQRGKGAVLRVLGEDIQHLWHIALGLNVKF